MVARRLVAGGVTDQVQLRAARQTMFGHRRPNFARRPGAHRPAIGDARFALGVLAGQERAMRPAGEHVVLCGQIERVEHVRGHLDAIQRLAVG